MPFAAQILLVGPAFWMVSGNGFRAGWAFFIICEPARLISAALVFDSADKPYYDLLPFLLHFCVLKMRK